MKVLIRLGEGKYYASKVFAIINNKIDYKHRAGYSYQYLVFNETGDNLILQNEFEPNSKYINKLVLI